MRKLILALAGTTILTLCTTIARADHYSAALDTFQKAGASNKLLSEAYGYALFPTIGKGGVVVGGAFGKGRVYEHGKQIGTATLTQASVGFQLGGQAYSQLILFQDRHALEQFTRSGFEFGADASAAVVTAGATVTASTEGTAAGASGDKKDATSAGTWYKGMAVFSIVKGGAMYELSLAGEKFTYKPGAG